MKAIQCHSQALSIKIPVAQPLPYREQSLNQLSAKSPMEMWKTKPK